jgi:putative transposase
MKKSPFSEVQIGGILKEHEASLATNEMCRKQGFSPATFYNWKAKFGGLEVSDVAKIKMLEDENSRLKRIVTDQIINIDDLKIVNSEKF